MAIIRVKRAFLLWRQTHYVHQIVTASPLFTTIYIHTWYNNSTVISVVVVVVGTVVVPPPWTHVLWYLESCVRPLGRPRARFKFHDALWYFVLHTQPTREKEWFTGTPFGVRDRICMYPLFLVLAIRGRLSSIPAGTTLHAYSMTPERFNLSWGVEVERPLSIQHLFERKRQDLEGDSRRTTSNASRLEGVVSLR